MSECKGSISYTISLRVSHPSASAVDISEALGMTPRIAQTVGNERRTPQGQKLQGHYDRTYLTTTLIPKTSGDFIDGISKALDAVAPRAGHIRTLLDTEGYCELFVGVFSDDNIDYLLGVPEMKRLVEFNLAMRIDCYRGPD